MNRQKKDVAMSDQIWKFVERITRNYSLKNGGHETGLVKER